MPSPAQKRGLDRGTPSPVLTKRSREEYDSEDEDSVNLSDVDRELDEQTQPLENEDRRVPGARETVANAVESNRATLSFIRGEANLPGATQTTSTVEELDEEGLIGAFIEPMALVEHSDVLATQPEGVCLQRLLRLKAYFGGTQLSNMTRVEQMKLAAVKFPVVTSIDTAELRRGYILALTRIINIFSQATRWKVLEDDRKRLYLLSTEISHRIQRLADLVMTSNSIRDIDETRAGSAESLFSIRADLATHIRCAMSINRSPLLKASVVIRREIARLGLRKHPDTKTIYEPVRGPDSNNKIRFLYAYRPFQGRRDVDLAYIVNKYCKVGAQVSDSFVTLEGSLRKRIISELEEVDSPDLPDLKVNKSLRAFKNGLYCIKSDTFFPWDCDDFPACDAAGAFYNVEFDTRLCLDEYRDPCCFAQGKWFGIFEQLTPNFKKFISFQFPKVSSKTLPYTTYKRPNACMRFVCGFFGRHFYELSEIEAMWQKSMVVIGVGGSGKSILQKILCKLVPNNFPLKASGGELTFGMERILGKDLVLVDELTENTSISADNILNMGSSSGRNSNATMVIPRKHKVQSEIVITQPIFATGNSFPSSTLWANEAGQQTRRWMGVLFDRKPDSRDPEIESKCLNSELSAILVLANRAYRSLNRSINSMLVDDVKSQKNDIEKFLPAEILRDTRVIMSSTDSAREFLSWSGSIVSDKEGLNSDLCIPLRVLKNEFEVFLKTVYEDGRSRRKKVFLKSDLDALIRISGCVLLTDNPREDNEDLEVKLGEERYRGYKTFAVDVHDLNPSRRRGNFDFHCQHTETQAAQCTRKECFKEFAEARVQGSGTFVDEEEEPLQNNWPFIGGCVYKLRETRLIDCNCEDATVLVYGIGIDMQSNERFEVRSEEYKGNRNALFRDLSTSRRVLKDGFVPEDKNRCLHAYLFKLKSHQYSLFKRPRESARSSASQFYSYPGAHILPRSRIVTEASDFLSPHDLRVVKRIEHWLDIGSINLQPGQLSARREGASRFVRFELFSLAKRLRKYVREQRKEPASQLRDSKIAHIVALAATVERIVSLSTCLDW